MRSNIDFIISESINSYLYRNVLTEDFFSEVKKKDNDKDKKKDDDTSKKKKAKKFRKNAKKLKGGLRGDIDVEYEETYNQNVDDQEESSIESELNNGFYNISAVAQKLYPDHTKEGAQSQLRKKLEGEHSDSGSEYKLKKQEVKTLRNILAKM